MAKQCAYCNSTGKMTREHIFPSSVISRYKESLVSINDKSESYFYSDHVIKDVCPTCNSGFLSELDDKFISLFDKYMSNPIYPGKQASLEFDYHSLLRFLLKVSYNSSRGSINGNQASNALKRYIPYIQGNEPSAHDVMLRLQIFTSAKKINANTNEVEGIIEASMLRSAKVPYDGPQCKNFIVRLIAFNSFCFYLIIPIGKTGRLKRASALKGFKKWKIQSGVPISAHNNKLVIPVEKTSYIHPSILNGMLRH